MNNLTVGDLKMVIESLPDDYEGLGISLVHSWRGSYDEPSFTLELDISKSQMLSVINECLTNTFTGWKGGEFEYCEYSPVNFDVEGSYSDGGYLLRTITEYPYNLFLNSLVNLGE